MVRSRGIAAALSAFACAMTGCMAVYSQRPVAIIATDAETGRPVPNLPVTVQYYGLIVLNLPKETGGLTDEHGRVLLTLADMDRGAINLRAGDYIDTCIRPELIREGGTTFVRNIESPSPKVTFELLPLPRSLAQRLFGYFGYTE